MIALTVTEATCLHKHYARAGQMTTAVIVCCTMWHIMHVPATTGSACAGKHPHVSIHAWPSRRLFNNWNAWAGAR